MKSKTMNKFLFISIICALGCLVQSSKAQIYNLESAASDQPINLLINGSFEQPDVLTNATKSTDAWITYGNGYSLNGPRDGFAGWSVTRGEIDVMNAQRFDSGSAADGLQFLDLDGRMVGAIAQTISVVPGKRYVLSFKYGRNSGASMSVQVTGSNSNILFSKQVIAGGVKTMENIVPEPWDEDGGSFTADGERVTLSFSSNESRGSVNGMKLDDVKIIPPHRNILSLQKTSNLSNSWITVPIPTSMITEQGELNLGQPTNASEFYRLNIRRVIE